MNGNFQTGGDEVDNLLNLLASNAAIPLDDLFDGSSLRQAPENNGNW
jgi:hypothetical protein